MPASQCVHRVCADAFRDYRRVPNPPELELQVFVSTPNVSAGMELGSSAKCSEPLCHLSSPPDSLCNINVGYSLKNFKTPLHAIFIREIVETCEMEKWVSS